MSAHTFLGDNKNDKCYVFNFFFFRKRKYCKFILADLGIQNVIKRIDLK